MVDNVEDIKDGFFVGLVCGGKIFVDLICGIGIDLLDY